MTIAGLARRSPEGADHDPETARGVPRAGPGPGTAGAEAAAAAAVTAAGDDPAQGTVGGVGAAITGAEAAAAIASGGAGRPHAAATVGEDRSCAWRFLPPPPCIHHIVIFHADSYPEDGNRIPVLG